ncbi:hypothetical protein G6F22_018720 [Rhizopus arrhizus]|nr:hypothetical protein G6F22_018720 [Rhizopus arrhizus]
MTPADGLRHYESLVRPHARHHRARCEPGGGAPVAWRRHPYPDPGRAGRLHRAAPGRALRCRRELATGRAAWGNQYVHRAHHREDAGRTSFRGRLGPPQPAVRHLCRSADVPRRPEARAGKAGAGAGAVLRAGRGHRQHYRAAACSARRYGWSGGACRHLRL